MTITVQNRLRIYEGDIILIPGCEPISVITHISNFMYNPSVTTMFNNFNTICTSSYISLKKAMELIPGHKLDYNHDMANRWFVLPDGPPPSNECPRSIAKDWYKILRENADGVIINGQDVYSNGECSSIYDFNWCIGGRVNA